MQNQIRFSHSFNVTTLALNLISNFEISSLPASFLKFLANADSHFGALKPVPRYIDPESNNEPATREQHFYREGNAEVLQLVTRGQAEDTSHHRYPTTLIVDGKDVLLRRFMQDQKARQELSMQEAEMVRTVESHQRPRNLYQRQQEVLLLPDDLEIRHRRADGSASNLQKQLEMDDGFGVRKADAESQMRDIRRHQEVTMISLPGMSGTERPSPSAVKAELKEQTQPTAMQSYAFHDLELARQNALLTRLLLERESRHVAGAAMDAASYLETQSLPGQVAIATQTDRVAATRNMERHVRSRSDNDESDEDTRNRKKMKPKKRYGENELKRTRALWMKSPIEEEESPRFDKRLSILREKVKEVKEGRKVSLEPEVLREISDSLDENADSCREREGKPAKTCQQPVEGSNVGYEVLREEKNGSTSSTEMVGKQQYEKTSDEKRTESLSSPEISVDNGKYVRETTEEKSSRKESRTKRQKVESVIKPSFRVLEREITMLTKKLSKLADRKVQRTTEHESTSQKKSKIPKASNRSTLREADDSRKRPKQPETCASTSRKSEKEPKREKFKYQQRQVISPDSSEYEDAFDKKSKFRFRQESTKQKQPSGQVTKAKKQIKMPIGRKEHKKQIDKQQERELEKRKDAASKESGRSESNTEKTVKSRAQKLGLIGRRENVSEEPGTSTGSDRTNGKKRVFADRDSDKKSTESAELPADQKKPNRKPDHVSEEFSDDFVTASQRKDIDQHTAFYLVDTSVRDTQDVAKYIQVMQQFSDDFTLDGQTKERQKSIISESEIEQSAIQDSDGEHVTMKEIVEDVASPRHLEYKQTKSKAMLDAMEKQQRSDFPEASNTDEFEDSRNEIISSDPAVLEEHRTEKLPSHTTVEGETFHVTENREKESQGSLEEVEKQSLEQDKITKGKGIDELKISTEMLASSEADVSQKCTEDSKVSSGAIEDAEHEEEHERNEHSDTVASPSETEKDSREQIEQVTLLSHPSEAVELREAESDRREETRESSRESKEREKEIPLAESSTRDTGQGTIEELMQQETEHDSPCKIKSDVKEDSKIATTDTTGHEDVTEKSKEIPEEHATRTIEEDVKSTTEAFEEEASDIKQSLKVDVGSNGILRVLLIDEDDHTLRYIDESSPETSKDNSMQSPPSEITDIMREDAETLRRTDDSPRRKVESRESAGEARTSDLQRTTESEKTDESQPVVHPTETISSKDEEQSPIERAKTKEELFPAEHEEESEEMSVVKERLGREVKEILDKDFPIDHSSKDSDPAESVANEPDDGEDKSETIVENVDVAEPRDKGEQRADVSVPIFSSFIDTLDVSEESDSSSDISRKTTLTPRPYGTPRNRQKWQQQENLETAGTSGTSKNEGNVESESEEDADSNLSLDEIQNEEDSITIEAAISETKDDTDTVAETCEKVVSIGEKILPVPDLQKVYNRDSDVSESRAEKDMELQAGVKSDERTTREALTTIQDNVLAIVNVKRLNGTSKEDVKDENILSTRENEERKGKIATPRREIEEIRESTEEDGKSKIRSSASGAEQIHPKRDGTRTKDSKVNKNGTKDSAATDRGRSKHGKKDGTPSTSEKHIAKPESSESYARKKKRPERSRIPSPQAEKKCAPDDKPEEKTTPSRSRSRIRKSVDGGSRKQPRREDQVQRRPTLPRSKPKVDRKPATSPKHAEIDVSKTRSKYMAWYNSKKREEAEKKKKLEKRATEDEEQLPRWVSRASRHPMAEDRKREPKGRQTTTPEMTPRTRRKIKPLVNVESEQLKAIVRQGRRLRRAEGNLNEDPSIEIYAGTPPVPFPDTQHRLLQHSEYKYERIPPPFYLHPPPAPHPSPQLSPDRFIETQPSTSQRSEDESTCLSNVAYQSGGRLRHQQLLEKKSVFDIAYSEAAPSQLRSDSATPPS